MVGVGDADIVLSARVGIALNYFCVFKKHISSEKLLAVLIYTI